MIIGIDEVGRGCWAGPLVAAAVGLDDDHQIDGLNDSKKITAKNRQKLSQIIYESTKDIGLGWVWPNEINKLGLTQSVRLAMERAFIQLNVKPKEIIIDGNYNYLDSVPKTKSMIKADGLIDAVSAASIIAKVARDAYMQNISGKYPEYSFEKNVGYGTTAHLIALKKYGITSLHRIKYKPVMEIIKSKRFRSE